MTDTQTGGKCLVDILIYAPSSWGKTTQIFKLADWLYKTKGQTTRLISCSGGEYAGCDSAVGRYVEATRIERRAAFFETLARFCEGWWPSDAEDLNSALMPPPFLKNRFPSKPCQSDELWQRIGLVAFDGLSEIADRLMVECQDKQARGENLAPDKDSMPRFRDGDTQFGNTTRGLYGLVQSYMRRYISTSKSIPGKIVVWTALPAGGDEDDGKGRVIGPDVIGNPGKARAMSRFSNVLRGELEVNKKTKQIVRKLYLKPQLDEYGVLLQAKAAFPFWALDQVPESFGPDELDPSKADTGLVRFLRLLEAAETKD